MELCLKNMEVLTDVMSKLKKIYGLHSSVIFTELGDLALTVEYSYEKYDLIQEIFVFNIRLKLERYITSYYHEWCGDNPCDKDICRLVVKIKF